MVSREGEWLVIDGRLINPTGERRHIFVREREEPLLFLPALVQVYDRQNKLIPMEVDYRDLTHGARPAWVRKEIDEEGIPFQIRTRQADHFSLVPESHARLWVLTAEGMEKLTLAQSLPPAELGRPSKWSKPVDGTRCRIRMAKKRFTKGEPIRFFFQAESDFSKADILWTEPSTLRLSAEIRIDGKPLPKWKVRNPGGYVYSFPFQREITLPRLELAFGRHTLSIRVKGRGGSYVNQRNEKRRKFKGTLVSKEVTFEFEPRGPAALAPGN